MADDVTQLISAAGQGDQAAAARLFALVYPELRQIAQRHLRGTSEDQFRTTSLVHEAYLRLAPREGQQFNDRGHFYASAARAMRQIVIDHVRRRESLKRGGDMATESLDQETHEPAPEQRDESLLALDEALERLLQIDPRLGQMVELWFYGGMTLEEIGEVTGLSPRTLRRDWRRARAFLYREVAGDELPSFDED
jgi:RNA polymerase sigma factor (TIGR02999 family)